MKNLDRLVDLEAFALSMLSGQTLLNFDARADNILIAGDNAYFVDLGPRRAAVCGLARIGAVCAHAGRART